MWDEKAVELDEDEFLTYDGFIECREGGNPPFGEPERVR